MTTIEVRCPHCDSSYRVPAMQSAKVIVANDAANRFVWRSRVGTVNSVRRDTDTSGESAAPRSGSLLKKVGRFEIEQQLGKGGFGTVYRARDPILERQVALKVPHPHLLSLADRQRYLREAKTAARLRHAHIVPLFEATISGDDLCIASAYIEGKPLDVVLRERRPGLVESVGWVIKLARALDYAHGQGFIYRDVKPSNIMLDKHGEPLLMDVGLARIIASDEQLTQTDSVLGTPAYMSPEQAAGRIHEISPATDQYSLGVVLYELLCGQRPFTGPIGLVISLVINTPPPPSEHDSQFPVELESICLRTMAKPIAERYGSLGEVAVELERYLENRRDSAIASGMGASPAISTPSAATPASDALLEVLAKLPASDRASAKSKETPPPVRSGDQGSSRPAWRPLLNFRGLGIRRLITVAGVAAILVVIFGAISLRKTLQITVNPSVIDHPVLAPNLATTPFSIAEAKSHQLAWSGYLNEPVELTNSIEMKLMLIPPGEFMMGSPEDQADRGDSELEHRVRITQPYYLGMHEVTQGEYERVMGTNPSYFSANGGGSEKSMDTSRFPVEQVSWEDAIEYCRRLSALPAERAAGRVYRLPTESEWEYACRAGTTTPFHFGLQLTGQQANFDGNYPYGITTTGPYLERTATVGSYESNGYGLFDMHGNVWEWCSDWYGDYTASAQVDPLGAAIGSDRVNRGGSWYFSAGLCRSAYRSGRTPDVRIDYLGFRVALSSVVERRYRSVAIGQST